MWGESVIVQKKRGNIGREWGMLGNMVYDQDITGDYYNPVQPINYYGGGQGMGMGYDMGFGGDWNQANQGFNNIGGFNQGFQQGQQGLAFNMGGFNGAQNPYGQNGYNQAYGFGFNAPNNNFTAYPGTLPNPANTIYGQPITPANPYNQQNNYQVQPNPQQPKPVIPQVQPTVPAVNPVPKIQPIVPNNPQVIPNPNVQPVVPIKPPNPNPVPNPNVQPVVPNPNIKPPNPNPNVQPQPNIQPNPNIKPPNIQPINPTPNIQPVNPNIKPPNIQPVNPVHPVPLVPIQPNPVPNNNFGNQHQGAEWLKFQGENNNKEIIKK